MIYNKYPGYNKARMTTIPISAARRRATRYFMVPTAGRSTFWALNNHHDGDVARQAVVSCSMDDSVTNDN